MSKINRFVFAAILPAVPGAVLLLISPSRWACADTIPTFSESVTVQAGAGGVGTSDGRQFSNQSNSPFRLSAIASSAGSSPDGGFDNDGYSWATSGDAIGGVEGAGIVGVASASTTLDNITGVGAEGYISVYVTRTVVVHLADPSQPANLQLNSTVNGSIQNAASLDYSISVSDGSGTFGASATNDDFSTNGVTMQKQASGTLDNVADGTVLTITQQLFLNAQLDGSGSESEDGDFGDTFWLQIQPTTAGVTLETSDGTDFTQPYVPEPGLLGLLGLSGLGLLARRRRA